MLHSFTLVGGDGGIPVNGVIFDRAGNLYGTAAYGGMLGYGVLFKLTPNPDGSWTLDALHSFGQRPDGSNPFAGLSIDDSGTLYGSTVGGGSIRCVPHNGCGLVFRLKPNSDGSWAYNVAPAFTHASGWEPNSSLALDRAGNLYGTTLYGGHADDGVTYKLSHQANGSWKYQELHEFVGTPAENPHGVILDKAGNLFGSASCSAGNNCAGLVYEITP